MPEFKGIRKILIVKPSALGDIVHTLPFLNAIKAQFPHAKVDWVVGHGLHTFLENHPMINRLWVIKKDQWKQFGNFRTTLVEINQLRKDLSRQRYDVCIDLSGLFRSGLITGFSKAPVRMGFKNSDEGSPLFYTHKIHGSMNIHAIDRYLKLAEFMGCRTDKVEYPFAPYDSNPRICRFLPGRYVVMSPSAGKPANRWPEHKYGELASRLKLPVVVIALAAEAEIAEQVVVNSKGNALSIAGQTGLKDLLAVIQKSAFFICNDTGPMHMAAALNIPVFAIFGPANPVRTGPYGRIHTIIQKKIPCAPCYAKHPCMTHRFKCMNELSVDDVLRAIQEKI